MKGYIKLHREISDHWLWDEKPFSKGQAWIDILLMANHDTKKFTLGNELIEVERGSCITSELKLMDRWGWSKTKVRDFLELLQKDKMLAKKSDKKKTTLTVCNYCVWQDSETTEKPQKNHRKTTERPHKNTNKNEEECKEVKKYIYSDFSLNLDLIQAITDFVEMRKKLKKPMTDKAIEMMLKKLSRLGDTDEKKIAILQESVMKSWTDIYELKGNMSRKVAEF
jgi:DNA replication protein DnaD